MSTEEIGLSRDRALRARSEVSSRRIAQWIGPYLASIRQSCSRAKEFYRDGDCFTAYLYLFVAFNNLYSLIAGFGPGEADKIREAVRKIPSDEIDSLYTEDYVRYIDDLNGGIPEQVKTDPTPGIRGIMNMKAYFFGKKIEDCVAHIDFVASSNASADDKLKTLKEVAASLLFAVRNNQFHAVKGLHRVADEETLGISYRLLLPLVQALLRTAETQYKGKP